MSVDPKGFQDANVVLVDSDAATNPDAIYEIEKWASENGFLRTTEYWLRVIRRDGRNWFRGICYRLTEEERASTEAYLDDVREAAKAVGPR